MLPLVLLSLLGCRELLTPDVEDIEGAPARWNRTLGIVVNDEGYVRYDLLEARRDDLDAYVAWLARDSALRGARNMDRHAMWLNAYNALVMYQVLERGRPESVMDVDGILPWAGSGFFLETEFQVGPERLSLSEIEHERIRMKEMDYRDHAAMNCASRSCPPLRNRLYTKTDLKGQLSEQMTLWVSDETRGMYFDGDTLYVNPIFEWFQRDFDFWSGGKDLCSILAIYNQDPDERILLSKLSTQGCPHQTFEYDWRLNDATLIDAGM